MGDHQGVGADADRRERGERRDTQPWHPARRDSCDGEIQRCDNDDLQAWCSDELPQHRRIMQKCGFGEHSDDFADGVRQAPPLSHTSQASTATAMPYANPVRRRSCGDARRMLLLVMSVDSLIVGSFEGESGISHIVKARLPRIAVKPHTNGQTFRGKGQPSAFQGVDFVFAKRLSTFRGVAKTRCPGY